MSNINKKQRKKRVLPKNVRKLSVKPDQKLSQAVCENMTVKQIRKSDAYRGLTPLGKQNRSGSYRYGHKSTMRKAELCRVLANPSLYHSSNIALKEAKKVFGARKRSTRKGECLVEARKIPCNGPVFKFQAITSTGKPCCFKKQMKQKTINKRLGNVAKAVAEQNKVARKRGRPKKKKSSN